MTRASVLILFFSLFSGAGQPPGPHQSSKSQVSVKPNRPITLFSFLLPPYTCHAPSIPPFQSTRPRGARLARHTPGVGHLIVSIHAPAWGATAARGRSIRMEHVSIHAPAWGATSRGVSARRILWMFQSTRPRGARPSRTCCEVAREMRITRTIKENVPEHFFCFGTFFELGFWGRGLRVRTDTKTRPFFSPQ